MQGARNGTRATLQAYLCNVKVHCFGVVTRLWRLILWGSKYMASSRAAHCN